MLPASQARCDGCDRPHSMDDENIYCQKYVDGLIDEIAMLKEELQYFKDLIEELEQNFKDLIDKLEQTHEEERN